MPEFLMVVKERAGGHDFITRHVIQANDRQMVKYHFHTLLKEMGYRDFNHGKHTLEGYDGLLTELNEIKRLDRHEYNILKEHVSTWNSDGP